LEGISIEHLSQPLEEACFSTQELRQRIAKQRLQVGYFAVFLLEIMETHQEPDRDSIRYLRSMRLALQELEQCANELEKTDTGK
jgi:hypothetical protein